MGEKLKLAVKIKKHGLSNLFELAHALLMLSEVFRRRISSHVYFDEPFDFITSAAY